MKKLSILLACALVLASCERTPTCLVDWTDKGKVLSVEQGDMEYCGRSGCTRYKILRVRIMRETDETVCVGRIELREGTSATAMLVPGDKVRGPL